MNRRVISVLGIAAFLLIFLMLIKTLLIDELHVKLNKLTLNTALLKNEIQRNRIVFMDGLHRSKTSDSVSKLDLKHEYMDLDHAKELHTMMHISYDTVQKSDRSYKLLILVSSHSRNSWRRNWIRSLWGNRTSWSDKDWTLVFVTGFEDDTQVMNELHAEADRYKDIVIEDILEDFHMMAKKVVIGLTWAKRNIKFENMLKADDDVFVNVDNTMKFVRENAVRQGYFGNVIINGAVDRKGRYGVSKKEHLADTYSPYCSGGGFILTNNSVFDLVPHFDINRVLKIDDAFVGEIAMKAGVPASETSGFYMTNSWCEYKDDMIVSHPAKEHKCMKFLTQRALKLTDKDSLYS